MTRRFCFTAITLCIALPAGVATGSVTIVDNLPGSWIDISGTGTALNLGDDDDVDIATTVGNALLPAGTVRVGSNGGARFLGIGTHLFAWNHSIPSAFAFDGDQALLPFWDDIDTDGGVDGNIFWEEIDGTLVIQWEGVEFWVGPLTTPATFQIQVPSSGPAFAQFLYNDIEGARPNGGGSATIGYQNGTGTANDVEWSFDTASAVGNGTVLSLRCDPCDTDCDVGADAFDIDPFLGLLFSGDAPCDFCAGDTDDSGAVDAFDVFPFLECLFGPGPPSGGQDTFRVFFDTSGNAGSDSAPHPGSGTLEHVKIETS